MRIQWTLGVQLRKNPNDPDDLEGGAYFHKLVEMRTNHPDVGDAKIRDTLSTLMRYTTTKHRPDEFLVLRVVVRNSRSY